MDRYGLTEEEKKTNLQQYNHALFRNNMFFTDVEWEINTLTGTMVVMENKHFPEKTHREYPYVQVAREYLERGQIRESDRPLAEQYMSYENLLKLTGEVSLDLRIKVHEDDQEFDHHRIVLTPAFDEDGKLYCVYMGARDLQSEERRELALLKSQEQFRDVLMSNCYFSFDFDVSGDGMIRKDFVTKTGYRPIQAACGMDLPIHYDYWSEKWYEIYLPVFEKRQEENIFTVDYMRRAFERNERLFDVEVCVVPPPESGASEFVQILVVLTEDPGDRHIHATVIWREISSERRSAIAENLELQSSNEVLRRTLSQEAQYRLSSLAGALMVYNINLTRDLIEDEFYEIVDGKSYPVLDLVGLTAPCSFTEFSHRWSERKVTEESREPFRRMFDRQYMLDSYARGKPLIEMEFDTVIGRGIPITLRCTALIMEDWESGDLIAMVSGKDVTGQRAEEHQRREALREAYEAANNANAAKSNFLARMSHDIRTPMNAIIGMTAIAGTHLDDPARVEDCLKKIAMSSKHLLSLINDVLDMSKIESGRIDLQEEAFNLPELLDNLLAMSRAQIEAKGHELNVSIHDIRHERVIGDSQRIQQSFMNLMSNAIKYTPEGGHISLTISEKPTNRPRVGCYQFIFEDDGIGMTREFQKKMFEPFTRAQDSRVEKQQGTGLGMAITRNIIQMMNGTIDVESELNKGTKVTVDFFLKLSEGDEKLDLAAFEDLPILVADDDEISCMSTCQMLEELGMKGEWVLTGREAVDRVARRHADGEDYYAIILDWKMPEMDGLSTAREIRREVGESIPIIILSDYDWSDIEPEARAAGANAFIGKPPFKSRVVHTFHELMGDLPAMDHRSAMEELAEEDLSGRRALLVEDNELNAEIATEILSTIGMTVERACNGKEAVDMVAAAPEGHYDIVFMDIQMPVMDGYEATRAIRALDRTDAKQVPILAMSANAFAEDVHMSKACGMNEHIAKPLDLAQLERALNRWLLSKG